MPTSLHMQLRGELADQNETSQSKSATVAAQPDAKEG